MDRRQHPLRLPARRRPRYLTPDPTEAPVVALIFERYTDRREGSAALAHWLTERGYRTRRGKPFNPKAVLGILRNRVYLGEIYFRGVHHQARTNRSSTTTCSSAPRPSCANAARTRPSDARTPPTTCSPASSAADAAASATSAPPPTANGGRYSYYVCFSRQRYGRASCDADRLPADKLEDAILTQLVSVLGNQPLVREAITQAHTELDTERPKRDAERQRLDTELKRANDALDRYFRAFENGTLPEQACGKRIDELARKITGLEARREELALDENDEPEPLSDNDLTALQAQAGNLIRNGDPPTRKASCNPSSTKSGSKAAQRSTRPSLCPRFDHRPL